VKWATRKRQHASLPSFPNPQIPQNPFSQTAIWPKGTAQNRPPSPPLPLRPTFIRPPGKGEAMQNELDRLRTKPNLLLLLNHYADLAGPSRETWQDRLMTMEGMEPQELSKLYGELIAFSWV